VEKQKDNDQGRRTIVNMERTVDGEEDMGTTGGSGGAEFKAMGT